MSNFLTLPESSPAAPLMAAIVHTGDMIHQHGELLSPEIAHEMFRAVAIMAELLLQAQALGANRTGLALADARKPGRPKRERRK